MADFTLGVAGHVDHGKTALVRMLTGIDTDRLPEEKHRGLTIEPGFAPLPLPDGSIVGLVDVPGHEKFIRNMLAGAAGLDAVLLCVAADDGPMPQTTEHLDICTLLGVRSGLIAVTKADLVSDARLSEVEEQITRLVSGTFLDGVPILPVSARTGRGIPALISAIAALRPSPSSAGREAEPFRLDIDRTFSKDGFGCIATGTITAGSVSVGDEVQIYPDHMTARVRNLQRHGEAVQRLSAGRRAALNLAGVEKGALRRGHTAAAPGSMTVTECAAGELELLPHAALPG